MDIQFISHSHSFKGITERRKLNPNAVYLSLVAVSLAACGGGSSTDTSSTSGQDTTPTNTTPIQAPVTAIQAPVIGQAGSELIIAKAGGQSTYSFSSQVAGFSLADPNLAVINVANDTADNTYGVELNATGAGTLEFKFTDANDVVVLSDESVISGFTELKVTSGTVDATDADLGAVDYVEVASSINLAVSQLSTIKNIVSASPTGKINIEISSIADLNALDALVKNGNVKIFSETGDALKLVKASGAVIADAVLEEGEASIGAAEQPEVQKPAVVLNAPQTVVAKKSAGFVNIVNNDNIINASEAQNSVTVKVSVEPGYTIKSVKMGGSTLSAGSTAGEYIINPSSFSDGSYTLVAEVVDLLGVTTTLSSSVQIDRAAPTIASVTIDGGSGGINAAEAAGPLVVTTALESAGYVSGITLDGGALSKNADGQYVLDASGLADGSYTLEVASRDTAGNTDKFSKSFSVDADGRSEAVISIAGEAGGLNASEVSAAIPVTMSFLEPQTIISATLDGAAVSLGSGSTFNISAGSLSDGVHTVSVVSEDATGVQVTSSKSFEVDTTPPGGATIQLVGDDNVLTASETTSSTAVFITPEPGSTLVSASIGAQNLAYSSSGGAYTFNATSLRGGRHEIEVLSSDTAGNIASSKLEFTVLGTSNGSNVFEIETTKVDDRVDFDVYIVSPPSSLEDGLPAYDVTLKLDQANLDFVEGSMKGSEGAFYAVGESLANTGTVRVSGLYQSLFTDYSQPFLEFSADVIGNASSYSIGLASVSLEYVDILDTNYFISI